MKNKFNISKVFLLLFLLLSVIGVGIFMLSFLSLIFVIADGLPPDAHYTIFTSKFKYCAIGFVLAVIGGGGFRLTLLLLGISLNKRDIKSIIALFREKE